MRPLLGIAVSLLLVLAGWGPGAASAAAAPADGFDPGRLVSDAAFYHAGAMTREEVAAFIAARGASCVASSSGVPCLKDYRVNTPSVAATAACSALPARSSNSAAGIISDVATACGVNPQMLLVLIQRESTLLTLSGSGLTTTAYSRATGAACPDYSGCASGWSSFFAQVYGAAEQFEKYRLNPTAYRHRAGTTAQIAYNPETTCGKASVTIANQATAGLYNYTPYVPNRAALDAGFGTGDHCSTYGNRNFYLILKSWFPGATSGSTAPAIAPSPPATLTPALEAVYARSGQLTLARTGSALAPMSCDSAGLCSKRFSRLSILWTASRGASLGYAATTPTLLPLYSDVPPGTKFFGEIEWLTATRVARGWSDGTFRPVEPVARDAMAAFLYRAAGSPAFTPPSRATFRDVPVGAPFRTEIEWLAAKGITTGWPDGTYRPYDPVNRDAMAAFLYRFSGSPSFTAPSRATFSDVGIGAQFRAEIEWLAARRISTGWPDGTYRPYEPVNRDAMAAFLYRRAG